MMRPMRTSPLLAALFTLACAGGQTTPPSTTTETPAAGSGTETPAPAEETSDAAASEPGEEATGEGEDTRTTQSIQKIVSANRKPIRACYDKARKDLPDLKGTMTIHFVLDPEGKVKKAELNVERSDIKSPDVVNCAIAELKKLTFPPSSKGMDTTVNYPFDFKPDGGG
jgi:outer membrane biosynthesis protein TonB